MEFDKAKLTQNRGKDGRPVYVAVDGKVYDVSESRLWKNGLHMNRHEAGQDLTEGLSAAPHGTEVLNKFKQIGILKSDSKTEQAPIPKWLANVLDAYPFLKRHPHPMVVHFPMAFFITASLFLLWFYVISPLAALLDAILYMHILGTLALPVAMITGWLSWLVNYFGKSNVLIKRKIILSFILLILDIIVLSVLINQPNLLENPQGIEIVLPIIVFCYLPIVSIIGEHGGKLVFPVHKKK